MSTTTPLTDSINALTAYANEVTGASDTSLSDAVATLASGYGSGGGGIDVNNIADGTGPSGSITLDTATSIAQYAFAYRPITAISSSSVTTINSSAFQNCSSLTSVYLPNANGASNYQSSVFRNCTSLTTIALPSYTSLLYSYFFEGCTALEKIDLSMNFNFVWTSSIFKNCSSLTTLILRRTSAICALNNVYHFEGTPFTSGGSGGTIYVPSALISSYQEATDSWATLSGYGTVTWATIEGSDYENYYADGTAIS